jgi:hypothetical protein
MHTGKVAAGQAAEEEGASAALELSSVRAASVDSDRGSSASDCHDSGAGLTPLQCLSQFENNKLRPLLRDLAKLKWGTFSYDYSTVDEHVAAAAAEAKTASTSGSTSKSRARTTTTTTSTSKTSTVFLAQQGQVLAPHQQPHHALFLEHLGLFVCALLMGAKVAEARGQWADCATVYVCSYCVCFSVCGVFSLRVYLPSILLP